MSKLNYLHEYVKPETQFEWEKEKHHLQQEAKSQKIQWERDQYSLKKERNKTKANQIYELEREKMNIQHKSNNNFMKIKKEQLALDKTKFKCAQKDKDDQMTAVHEWIQQGKNTEITNLLWMIYGSWSLSC